MSDQAAFNLTGAVPVDPASIETRRPDGTHRVVITGRGAISPAGVGIEALWDAVYGKKCCIERIERFDTDEYEVHIAGEVRDFDPVEHGLTKKEARRFERFVQYAIVASDEALEMSGLKMEDEDPDRVAGMKGECLDIVTACATGANSIGTAVRDIRHGYADVALAGGTEESISPICIAGFANLSALTKAEDPRCASLPFDARRSGFVAGEGAGAVVLESLEHALARGARIVAEVVGYGATGDAYHMTAPSPDGEGIRRAMEQALAEGGFTAADLGHLNAHGTGTPANDSTESHALIALCGEEAGSKIPVTSVKGSLGHTLGAAGALEAIITALSVANDCVPPTCGFAEADPDCAVAVATEPIVGLKQKVALSNSLGFGGHNACLAISPFDGAGR